MTHSMESKSVWWLSYRRLDDRITELFGRPYRSLTGLDYRIKGNDMYVLIDMRDWGIAYEHIWIEEMAAPPGLPDDELEASDRAMLDEVMRRWVGADSSPAPEVVLGVAIRDGHMPPGEYLIEISW